MQFFLRQDGWTIDVCIKRKQKVRKNMVEYFSTLLLHHNAFHATLNMFYFFFNMSLHSTSYKVRWVMPKVKLDN